MKNEKNRYISYRVSCIFFVLFLFTGVLLAVLTVLTWNEGHNFSFVAVGWLFFCIILYISYSWLLKAYKENAKITQLFVTGYTLEGIFNQRVSISPDIEAAIKRFKEMMNTNELINATKKQAEYLALQNQINPHFLYNTLEGIRGEALSAGLDNAAEMMEALATFFRYTISNIENLVTLEDEISNIENYFIIQQYRFGERLQLSIEYDVEEEIELFKYRLPKLTLQPIVENAIYHGIERKVGKGNIRLKIENTAKLLIVTISDDGVGMSEERLAQINEKLNRSSFDYVKTDSETKGGIAMVNVNNRIKLMFGEEYGICIYSTYKAGTDVEIMLPLVKSEG